jgi:predicted transcriptional regulator
MTKVQVHVGNLKGMGERFVGAWKRAERGEPVRETHVTFLDLETMQAALSTRRLELLWHLR